MKRSALIEYTYIQAYINSPRLQIKDLSQKICDTRAGVTNVKSVIDGMRTQRDTSMSEMAQLKVRIKEQNAKLLQLTQERAKWDAKSKVSAGVAGETAQQEQLNAAFAHKQVGNLDNILNRRCEKFNPFIHYSC